MLDRRQLFQLSAAAAGSMAAGSLAGCATAPTAPARPRRTGKVRILHVGIGGSIAPADREQLKAHPDVVFTGFCDVDQKVLDDVGGKFPDAFRCRDFREAFAKHGNDFDAVLVCVPDHNHAVVMLTALKAGKHVYGQKPLVQQLAEVTAMERMLAARPDLVTQVGNQRMGYAGRQRAVDVLRLGLLGKAREAHVWVDGPGDKGNEYFWYGGLKDPTPPPENVDWQLWLGCAEDAPHREGLIGLKWRSSWDYGTGQLGDWCTHLLDVLYYAYDLPSPLAVLSHTRWPSDFYHAQHVHSVLTYPGGPQFAGPVFPVHYNDKGQRPSLRSLGLPAGKLDGTGTLVVCEHGALFVAPEGRTEVWRDGKPVKVEELTGLPERKDRNHWHSWIDTIQGKPGAFLQSPFAIAVGMAEAGLLCAKAARFPGQELLWDKAKLAFTNHEEATSLLVRRKYRAGFELPTA